MTQGNLKSHQLNHSDGEKIVCNFPECGKIYLSLEKFKLHERIHVNKILFSLEKEHLYAPLMAAIKISMKKAISKHIFVFIPVKSLMYVLIKVVNRLSKLKVI